MTESADGLRELPTRASSTQPPWLPVATAIGSLAGLTALVYAVGGAIVWSRLHGAGIAADEAMGVVPQQTVVAVGARSLLFPGVLAIAAFALGLLLERATTRTRRDAETSAAAAEASDTDNAPVSPEPGRLRRIAGSSITAARRLLHRLSPALSPVMIPVRWYFRYVPRWLWVWLPALFFLPDPLGVLFIALSITASTAIGEWAGQHPSARMVGLRSALGLAGLAALVGLFTEWHEPKLLPQATIVPRRGNPMHVGFVAVSGGDAYVADHGSLTVIPASAYRRLTIFKAKKHPPERSPSLFERVMP